jgi:hypothetical protein
MTAPVRRDVRATRARVAVSRAPAVRRSSRAPLRDTTSHRASAQVAVDRRRLPHPSPARPPPATAATTPAAPAWPSSPLQPVESATTHPPSLPPTRPIATPDTQSGDSGGPSGLPHRPSAMTRPQPAATALVPEAYVQAAARAEKRPRQQAPPPEPRSARRQRRRARTNPTEPEPPLSPARQRPKQHGATRSQSHRSAALAVADYRPSIRLTPEIANSPKMRAETAPAALAPCARAAPVRRSHHPYVASRAEKAPPDFELVNPYGRVALPASAVRQQVWAQRCGDEAHTPRQTRRGTGSDPTFPPTSRPLPTSCPV